MEAAKVTNQEVKVDEEIEDSLKGTFFSSIVFVGGGIVFFWLLLFLFYTMRV